MAKELKNKIQKFQPAESEQDGIVESLYSSQTLFKLAFNSSPSLMSISTLTDGRILEVNEAFIRTLGYSRKELLGRTSIELGLYADEADRYDMIEILKQKGRLTDHELCLRSKSGEERIVLLGVAAIKVDGRDCLLVSAEDISERKRSEKRAKKLNQLNEDLIFTGNLNDKLKRITDGVVEIFHADFARIWLIKAGDLCNLECSHAQIMEGPHVCKNRNRCLHLLSSSGRYNHIDGGHKRVPYGCYKIGRVASGEDSKFVINDVVNDPLVHDKEWARKLGLTSFAGYRLLSESGTPIGVLALFSKQQISSDISSLIESLANTTSQLIQTSLKEEELKRSEAKFRGLVESTIDWIWEVNSEGVYTYASPQVETILGYKDDEVIGKTPFDLMPPEEAERIEKLFKDALEKGRSIIALENLNIHKDGRRILLETSGVPFFNESGKVVGFRGIDRDITEYKRVEEEKRKALEFAAENRKHALIGQIAGKMAHDFNNVLMGIMGNSQLAILECSDEKTKEKLERINEFSERGRDITSNLISFSKDQEPKQTYFRVEDKIDLVVKMFKKELEGVKLIRNYKPGIPELLGDPGMIQDVIANLIQNSIHAMSKVEKPILILQAYSKYGKIYFTVEDNGCGIPKEHQESVFSPYFSLKGNHDKIGAYDPEIKGTGYGMANVRKYIIEKHKGEIFLESEVGKGTKIKIALKIIKAQLSSDEKKEVKRNQVFDKRRILLVEDEAAIADVQYQILTREPFSHIVSIAVNGQTAIDIFNRNKFDLVSLDYMLPGRINGLNVYDYIRKNDTDIPIIFISGNIEFLESMKKLKEEDPNLEHLSKPLSNLEYVNKINELIGRSST